MSVIVAPREGEQKMIESFQSQCGYRMWTRNRQKSFESQKLRRKLTKVVVVVVVVHGSEVTLV
ncbi:hypothetical protein E2C01_039005 [Portunus trituberculatus]|uniref:Uncharacterized protein n=1 Tax=Portunus trituberculatus TaxID=210409 RepID=A0A5B7FJG5_PORTR|nr:hypothetical protein [Portunus trituberculatus]